MRADIYLTEPGAALLHRFYRNRTLHPGEHLIKLVRQLVDPSGVSRSSTPRTLSKRRPDGYNSGRWTIVDNTDIICRTSSKLDDVQDGPDMDPIVTTFASRTAIAVAKPLQKWISSKALGSLAERQIDEACRRAAIHVIKETIDEGATESEIEHATGLLVRLLEAQAVAAEDLTTFVRSPASWSLIAANIGLDEETFPSPFIEVVDRISEQLPIELERQAAGQASALFSPFMVESIVAIRRQLNAINGIDPAILQIPLQSELRDALSDRSIEDRISTPDLLLALLSLPSGSVKHVVDSVERGLSENLRRELGRFVTSGPGDYAPRTSLKMRADFRAAQALAAEYGMNSVDDVLLFTGFMNSKSSTRTQLLARLRGDKYVKLEQAMRTLLEERVARRASTPWGVFVGEDGRVQ